jgi:hypothetical protein
LIKKLWNVNNKTKRKEKIIIIKGLDLTLGPTIVGQAHIGLEARNAWA